jgi:transposase-like protein
MALKRLNPEHYIAIKWLAQPRKGGKTIKEIAELCGVSEQSIYNWRKDPLFERELKKEMIRRSQDKLPELIDSLAEIAIRDGNAAMAKLALQINGMLTDKVEIETKQSTADIDYDALDDELDAFEETLTKEDE